MPLEVRYVRHTGVVTSTVSGREYVDVSTGLVFRGRERPMLWQRPEDMAQARVSLSGRGDKVFRGSVEEGRQIYGKTAVLQGASRYKTVDGRVNGR
jgi:hypothetical protein